ncbi:MAG TPA: ABC transporter ATP-binding protein [Terriglobales bacterium]|jgi:oligopeptide/dipeptide ABC transporter ATP-binding protein|nr:ABC transporter ATP-binding protein [Terriglobales bacterium]
MLNRTQVHTAAITMAEEWILSVATQPFGLVTSVIKRSESSPSQLTEAFIGDFSLMWTPSNTMPSGASPLLAVRGLTLKYGGSGKPVTALHDVNFDLASGEIVGILGESGSGKSSFALSIVGLLPAKASVGGSIRLQDKDLLQGDESSWQAIRGARISMISQEPGLALNPVMRVGDQIAEVIRAHRPGRRKIQKQESEAILRELCLSDVDRIYKAYPHQLSGGQLHRVVIAQAVACHPQIVIADEPMRSLDVTVQAEILEVFRAVNRTFGTALIFITHNPALLVGFADRVIVMYAGRIVEDGPVAQVFRRPLHPYTKGLLQLARRNQPQDGHMHPGRLPAIPGSLTNLDRLAQGCVFEPRCSARTAICHSESPIEVTPEQGRRVSCFNHGN